MEFVFQSNDGLLEDVKSISAETYHMIRQTMSDLYRCYAVIGDPMDEDAWFDLNQWPEDPYADCNVRCFVTVDVFGDGFLNDSFTSYFDTVDEAIEYADNWNSYSIWGPPDGTEISTGFRCHVYDRGEFVYVPEGTQLLG